MEKIIFPVIRNFATNYSKKIGKKKIGIKISEHILKMKKK